MSPEDRSAAEAVRRAGREGGPEAMAAALRDLEPDPPSPAREAALRTEAVLLQARRLTPAQAAELARATAYLDAHPGRAERVAAALLELAREDA